MKVFNTVMKVLAALAAVAGAVHVVATYGDRIVAWAKKLLHTCPCHCCGNCCEDDILDEPIMEVPQAPVSEEAAPAEDAPAEEAVPEEAFVEVPPVEDAIVADDTDFEG